MEKAVGFIRGESENTSEMRILRLLNSLFHKKNVLQFRTS